MQRALAHPSLAERHSYPPQPCFCQIPKPSPAELLPGGYGPSCPPRGRHAPPVSVITEALTGPIPALPCHRTSCLSPLLPNCLLFTSPYNFFRLHLPQLNTDFPTDNSVPAPLKSWSLSPSHSFCFKSHCLRDPWTGLHSLSCVSLEFVPFSNNATSQMAPRSPSQDISTSL